jgi:hypothetical protein
MASPSPAINESAVVESLKNLNVSGFDTAANDLTPQTNPWLEGANTSQSRPEPIVQPTSVDTAFVADLPAEAIFDSKEKLEVDREILDKFDPLRNKDERAAKDAWEHTESHPPSTLSHDADRATPPRIAIVHENQDKDRDQQTTFDFQKFLDQIKSKGAEPVAKYLRSYVC